MTHPILSELIEVNGRLKHSLLTLEKITKELKKESSESPDYLKLLKLIQVGLYYLNTMTKLLQVKKSHIHDVESSGIIKNINGFCKTIEELQHIN